MTDSDNIHTINCDSDVYVVFPTGHQVKRLQLQKSQFFDCILSCVQATEMLTASNLDVSDNKADSHSIKNIISLPLPDGIERGAAVSYLDYCVSRQHDYQHMLACLASCSLLDDTDYLQFCVKRFLRNYSDYKTILSQLNPVLLEQVYLLMPKDLLPEQLQASDTFMRNWISKQLANYYFFGKDDSGDNYCMEYEKEVEVCFQVDDISYPYTFRKRTGSSIRSGSDSLVVYCKSLSVLEGNKNLHIRKFVQIAWDIKARRRVNQVTYDLTESASCYSFVREWNENGVLIKVERRDRQVRFDGVCETYSESGLPVEFANWHDCYRLGLTTKWFNDSNQVESHTWYDKSADPTGSSIHYFTKFYLSGRIMMVDDKLAGVCYYYLDVDLDESTCVGNDSSNSSSSSGDSNTGSVDSDSSKVNNGGDDSHCNYGGVRQPLFRITISDATLSQQNRNLLEIKYYDDPLTVVTNNGVSNTAVSNCQQKVKTITYHNNNDQYGQSMHSSEYSQLDAVTIPLKLPDIPKYY